MKFFTILMIFSFFLAPMSIAYPQDQLKECVITTKQNPAIQGISDDSIQTFCDCSLKLIIDEEAPPQKAGNECAQIAFK